MDIGELLAALLVTAIFYLLFPLLYKMVNGKVDKEKGTKLALLNSVILEAIFALIGIVTNLAPSTNGAMFAQGFLYYFIAKAILVDPHKAPEVKETPDDDEDEEDGDDDSDEDSLAGETDGAVGEDESPDEEDEKPRERKAKEGVLEGYSWAMKERFKKYLIDSGYKEYTPRGNPSTVYDYLRRIESVINWEHYNDWIDVAKNIYKLCEDYSETGIKAHLGARSHSAVISALRRYKEFIEGK